MINQFGIIIAGQNALKVTNKGVWILTLIMNNETDDNHENTTDIIQSQMYL
jgi:hypothetical protein